MSRRDTKLTDAAVDALPLHGGRAELLEEIMSTAVTDTTPVRRSTAPARRTPRYLVPLAAAAVVAALATGPLWWGSDSGAGPDPDVPVATETDPDTEALQDAVDNGAPFLPALDDPEWVRQEMAPSGTSVTFTAGDAELRVAWRDGSTYDVLVADRSRINEPPSAGEPVEIDGVPGQLWSYGPDDHTVLREVEDGYVADVRGQGLDEEAFVELLDGLTLLPVDNPALEGVEEEREVVRGITDVLPDGLEVFPSGSETAFLTFQDESRYDLGTTVAGTVACSWLNAFVVYERTGDVAGAADAVAVLGTSRDWPILQEMAAEGDYPERIWQYADTIAAGDAPTGYRQALDCP